MAAPPPATGLLDYEPRQSFLLHVFWQAPNLAAARQLLEGLRKCAVACHRDTPCTVTYFFRISSVDSELCEAPPCTIGDHPQLSAALKRLACGVPQAAVHGDLAKLGLDPALLSLPLAAPLPEALKVTPVRLEFTEVYLDERAFLKHASSKDFLAGYGIVMNPAMMHRPATTVRLGTPTTMVVEKILEPMLKERVAPLPNECKIWNSLRQQPSSTALLLSLDFVEQPTGQDPARSIAARLPQALTNLATTCVCFAHPLRPLTERLLCVLPSLPKDVVSQLAELSPVRGEIHMPKASSEELAEMRSVISTSALHIIVVNGGESAGYVLHDHAHSVQQR